MPLFYPNFIRIVYYVVYSNKYETLEKPKNTINKEFLECIIPLQPGKCKTSFRHVDVCCPIAENAENKGFLKILVSSCIMRYHSKTVYKVVYTKREFVENTCQIMASVFL